MIMVARNLYLFIGLLLAMRVVIVGGVISRHVVSIVTRVKRTLLCIDPLIVHTNRIVAMKIVTYKGDNVVYVNICQ